MKNSLLIILISFSLFGCRFFDKPELIPSYIYVDEFIFTTTTNQGSDSHKIKDCWVYVDQKLIGVYELPAKVPIFANGTYQIDVYPGIYKNGIKEERIIYPFYTHYTGTHELLPENVIPITPEITYIDGLNMWIEDFEDPGFKWNVFATLSDTTMFVANPSQFAGLFEGKAGLIKMSSNNVVCEMRTDEPLFDNLPRNLNIPAYFEMNYKANHTFYFGLLHNNTGLTSYSKETLITFNPTTDENGVPQWNKTYLYIPDVTNFFQSATKFDFFINVFNNNAIDGIEIYFDNMKVVFE